MSEEPGAVRQNSNRHNTAQLLLWGEVNSSDIDESALNDWWTNEHLPERLSIPGFSRARRYYSRDEVANTTHYLTLYEVADLDVLTSPQYMDKLNNPTPRTQEHIPTLASMNRAACKVLHCQGRPELYTCGSYIGGALTMISSYLPNENVVRDWQDFILRTFSTLYETDKCTASFTILQEDRAATEPGSSSASYHRVRLRRSDASEGIRIVVLVEFSGPVRPSLADLRKVWKPFMDQIEVQQLDYIAPRIFNFMCCVSE